MSGSGFDGRETELCFLILKLPIKLNLAKERARLAHTVAIVSATVRWSLRVMTREGKGAGGILQYFSELGRIVILRMSIGTKEATHHARDRGPD